MSVTTTAAIDTMPKGDVVIEALPTQEAFMAAVHAVSIATDTKGAASSALARITLAYYVEYASRYERKAPNGIVVLPDSSKSDVATLVILAATGLPSLPSTKPEAGEAKRSPGETSLGQYLSRYARVATNVEYGMKELASTTDANAAHKAIAESKAAAKANLDAAVAAQAEIQDAKAFGEWLDTQSADLKTAFKRVRSALKNDGAPHLPAFIASVTTPQS